MKRALFVVVASCALGDPVHDDLVASLGPETSAAGPLHRAGQPCLACHGGSGPARDAFAAGGTIFLQEGKPDPLEGGLVQITDNGGAVICSTHTNAAGNFFIPSERCKLPAQAKVNVLRESDGAEANMITRIGHDGSCATCHHGDAPTQRSLPKIYLLSADQP